MYVGAGFLSLLGMLCMGMLGFLVARVVVARLAGVRGWLPILAIDQKPWAGVALGKRALFAFSGPIGTYVTAALFMTAGFFMAGETTYDESSMHVSVRPQSAAADAGIVDGDQIVAVSGVPIRDWDGLKSEVAKHADQSTDVVVRRGDQTVTIQATPNSAGKLGLMPPAEHRSVGIGSALGKGFVEPASILKNAAHGFFRMFARTERPEVSGPVAIASETGRAQQSGLGQLLRLLGGLMSYFLLVPLLVLSLVFFPRSRAAS